MEVQEVKNVVNTARDLLVGKVPLPVDQCQEITRALIYKFLSASDAASVALGGQPAYFTGELARCRWDALMRPEQTANDVDRLYRDGMALLGRADVMPAIRTIYQDAYIPYNDPIILRDFLRAIDRFDTADTEKIGDAYEMLLQDLGAQASAGQFRTPRHVIDFIVAIIDPQKHETILDPACGTGGFLASAWEHINRAGRLSAADRGNLARNLVGYDISPTMAMLSTVNLFLHHRQQPDVSVYDTLTNEERWNDHYDVILANPPFMSPKGGIRPHGRFFTNSKRSEVLFVDYIMGHLNDSGRAGVIVPEGVIFQSQRAHTQLRRLLVEIALVAVISLPAGVFQPYSGVKTSILILDKTAARRADGIAFFKVENDGYDLGAQRRPIDRNDLPTVQAELGEYLRRRRAGESVDDFAPAKGLVVAKERIAEGGDYNLSGERYREATQYKSDWPIMSLSKLEKQEKVQFLRGSGLSKRDIVEDGANFCILYGELYTQYQPIIDSVVSKTDAEGKVLSVAGDVLIPSTTTADAMGIAIARALNQDGIILGADINIVRTRNEHLDSKYLSLLINFSLKTELARYAKGVNILHISNADIRQLQIPLPPLEVQREIVAEIEGYQRVIDGARAVVDNWRPRIAVDPEWPMAGVSDLTANIPYSFKAGPFGSTLKKDCYVPAGYKVYGQEQVIRGDAHYGDYYIDDDKYRELENCKVQAGDVLISLVGTYGKTLIIPDEHEPGIINPRLVKITLDRHKMVPEFFACLFAQDFTVSQMHAVSHGGTMNILSMQTLKRLRLPVPPVETQQAIVAEIEAERALVSANRELAARMEGRIAAAVGRVWGSS